MVQEALDLNPRIRSRYLFVLSEKNPPVSPRRFADSGFSLVEAVMAAVVLSVVGLMSIAIFNSIIGSINKTDQQAKVNAAIDNDISRIKQITQAYNACGVPTGGISTTGCGVYGEANAYYYFPDPANSSSVNDFESACSSSTSHITAEFINLIDDPVASGVDNRISISKTVSREDQSASPNPENYNVIIQYSGPGGVSRRLVVAPFLSFWCS